MQMASTDFDLDEAGATAVVAGDQRNKNTPGSNDLQPDDIPPPLNIWQRLQSSFSLESPTNPRIALQRNHFLKYPTQLSRTQEQSSQYLGYVLDELDKRNLPGELALIPMVESGYRPHARSYDRATGIWQFIPATAKAFGLTEGRWFDSRKDLVSSTRAALDYLTQINQEFDGDWALSLAAYNAGSPAVRRAIKKNSKQGKPTDYWSLDLPSETKVYVPKILALKQIYLQPEQFGVALVPTGDKSNLELFRLDGPTDLQLLANLADLDLEDLRRLNPGFKGWHTGVKGPHRLLLPADRIEPFSQRLAAVPLEDRLRLQPHKVTKGDTLAKIAKRYKSDVELIQHANQLKSKQLKLASTLLVPTPYPPAAYTGHTDLLSTRSSDQTAPNKPAS
ncbi:MAG: transglycosylase SLT domain-containing protein [Gammaproteobacteria bacterium]|nr:transglycosylase SLT domain-containing protein [Gammaproteobacteria bacterium]